MLDCYADTMEIAFNTQRNAFVILYRISNNATASSGTCAANGTITIHSTIGVMYTWEYLKQALSWASL